MNGDIQELHSTLLLRISFRRNTKPFLGFVYSLLLLYLLGPLPCSAVVRTELYDILGVSPHATPSQIRVAYRRLARKYHPDVNKETMARDAFERVQKAYDVLGRSYQTREEYDRTGIIPGETRNSVHSQPGYPFSSRPMDIKFTSAVQILTMASWIHDIEPTHGTRMWLVFVYSTNSVVCYRMAPHIDFLAQQWSGVAKFGAIHAHRSNELVMRLGIHMVPSLIVRDLHGLITTYPYSHFSPRSLSDFVESFVENNIAKAMDQYFAQPESTCDGIGSLPSTAPLPNYYYLYTLWIPSTLPRPIQLALFHTYKLSDWVHLLRFHPRRDAHHFRKTSILSAALSVETKRCAALERCLILVQPFSERSQFMIRIGRTKSMPLPDDAVVRCIDLLEHTNSGQPLPHLSALLPRIQTAFDHFTRRSFQRLTATKYKFLCGERAGRHIHSCVMLLLRDKNASVPTKMEYDRIHEFAHSLGTEHSSVRVVWSHLQQYPSLRFHFLLDSESAVSHLQPSHTPLVVVFSTHHNGRYCTTSFHRLSHCRSAAMSRSLRQRRSAAILLVDSVPLSWYGWKVLHMLKNAGQGGWGSGGSTILLFGILILLKAVSGMITGPANTFNEHTHSSKSPSAHVQVLKKLLQNVHSQRFLMVHLTDRRMMSRSPSQIPAYTGSEFIVTSTTTTELTQVLSDVTSYGCGPRSQISKKFIEALPTVDRVVFHPRRNRFAVPESDRSESQMQMWMNIILDGAVPFYSLFETS